MTIEFDEMPAFPCSDDKNNVYAGMLLKDYFATHIAQGLLACTLSQTILGTKMNSENIAKLSYDLADSMIAERLRRYK